VEPVVGRSDGEGAIEDAPGAGAVEWDTGVTEGAMDIAIGELVGTAVILTGTPVGTAVILTGALVGVAVPLIGGVDGAALSSSCLIQVSESKKAKHVTEQVVLPGSKHI
jgi:hypothetical protein